LVALQLLHLRGDLVVGFPAFEERQRGRGDRVFFLLDRGLQLILRGFHLVGGAAEVLHHVDRVLDRVLRRLDLVLQRRDSRRRLFGVRVYRDPDRYADFFVSHRQSSAGQSTLAPGASRPPSPSVVPPRSPRRRPFRTVPRAARRRPSAI